MAVRNSAQISKKLVGLMSRPIIVTGGRDFSDHIMLADVLDFLNPDMIIQGGAPGADDLARNYGVENNIAVVTVQADWNTHGKAAGPIRNRAMLDRFKEAVVVAFPGGKGTADCVRAAISKNMIVLEVK